MINSGDLGEGVPEEVEPPDGVELFPATVTGGKALLVVLAQMGTKGRAVFSASGGGVMGVLGATSVGANP